MSENTPDTKPAWALFLDRDGVINKRLPGDYIKRIEQFRFLDGVKEALVKLKETFSPIVIVSNQQGIGKRLMSDSDLAVIHRFMLDEITDAGGCIDDIYYCPALESEDHPDRKPNTGMAHSAKLDYPEIDFSRSVMVGDSEIDMQFGKKLGMRTVFLADEESAIFAFSELVDLNFRSLDTFANWVLINIKQFQ